MPEAPPSFFEDADHLFQMHQKQCMAGAGSVVQSLTELQSYRYYIILILKCTRGLCDEEHEVALQGQRHARSRIPTTILECGIIYLLHFVLFHIPQERPAFSMVCPPTRFPSFARLHHSACDSHGNNASPALRH